MPSDNLKIIGIIPARGGSKGIPKKNIRLFAGKPLIVWTIEHALQCCVLNKIIVSTDDEDIAKISRNAGAEVPFLRPKELAHDDTPDFPVYDHALKWLSENQNYQHGTCSRIACARTRARSLLHKVRKFSVHQNYRHYADQTKCQPEGPEHGQIQPTSREK